MTHPFTLHVKPRLGQLLSVPGLDVSYERAEGNTLYWRDEQGREHAVLDLLGGYGSLLFGHNHPELVETARTLLGSQTPVHAQISLRRRAGELGARLGAIAARETGGQWEFMSLFASSGDEVVEAALKHAEFDRGLTLQALLDDIALNLEAVRDALRRGAARLPQGLFEFSAVRERHAAVRNAEELFAAVTDHNTAQLAKPAVFLALEHAFHGELCASVQLTHNPRYRAPFRQLGPKVRFVPANDTAALQRIGQDEKLHLLDLALENGTVVLRERALPVFAAFVVEPLQGEGGVHELDADFAREIRRFCNQHDVPLIVDEIQCGMGRCGSFFAATQIGLKGDYYTLSQALGGGLAKIGALLIRKERYRAEFGLLHSSAFVDDDYSCGIALKVLELLEADAGAACRRAAELGESLRARLLALRERYPEVISDVRGRGLLLGVEFAPQLQADSQIIRGADVTDSLGYLLSGYLLHRHGLRATPPSGASRVLRLLPSLLTTQAEVERIAAALEQLCLVLQRQDALHVVFALTQPTRPMPREDVRDFRNAQPVAAPGTGRAAPTRAVRKVAFVNHLISPQWLRQVDPSLAELSDEELRRFVLRMAPAKRSAPYPPVRIQSPLGPAVDFILYPLCVVSEQMGGWLAAGDLAEIRADIQDHVRAARDGGCEIAGLGMYTSIVTNNCTALKVPAIGLTSGNSLTVAMSIEALERAVRLRGLQWPQLTLAVVGAAGNIASTYCAMLAERAQRMVLIGSGRDGSMQRVRATMHAVYEECWQQLLATRGQAAGGMAARLAQEPLIAQWLAQGAPAQHRGRLIHEALVARHGQDPFIRVSLDAHDVREADVVLCAANAPEPFLEAQDFRHGAVVCDVAVPHNVRAQGLAQRPDLDYMRGGIVATPNGESLHPSSRAFLEEGQIFACMAETVVLGLAGMSGHYSHGAISPRQVREIAALAAAHGFTLADYKQDNSL